MKNEMYIAPEVEILNVEVEAGFAGSDPAQDITTPPVNF